MSHKARFVGLHLGLFLASFAAGVHGFQGAATMQDGFVLLGAACWLGASLSTWASGVPEHVKRQKLRTPQTDP